MSNFEDFSLMMFVQRRKIETDRYYEGLKVGHDPREDSDYDLNWILRDAQKFRKDWRSCLCKACNKAEKCGFKLAKQCPSFQPTNQPTKNN